MTQTFLGEILKEQGMSASLNNANRKQVGWSEIAMGHLLEFCYKHPGHEIMGEDIRHYAKLMGLPDPPSQRAWGAIIRKAVHDRILVFVRYNKVSNPKAHQENAAVWRVTTQKI